MRKKVRCRKKRKVLQSQVSIFYAISNGKKRVYTNKDGVKGYGRNLILNPRNVSYTNLFINGVLQPRALYKIKKGQLILISKDVPNKGVPIGVQFIKIYLSKKKVCKKRKVCKRKKHHALIIKPFVSAKASAPVARGGTITTTVKPNVKKFHATITDGMIGDTQTTIPAASFIDDNGTTVTNLPSKPTNGYINVYVNGILQENNLSSLSTTQLVFNSTAVYEGTPVTLEVSNFSNTNSTITSEPTISPPDITITV